MKIIKKSLLTSFLIILVLINFGLVGCTESNSDQVQSTPDTVISTSNSVVNMNNYTPRLEGKAKVSMTLNNGTIIMEIDGNEAPVTAGNFVDLVNRGVYDGLVFHRVVKEPQPFVAQAGDPQSQNPNFPSNRLGTGGFVDPDTNQTRYIPLEIKPKNGEEPIYSKTFQQAGTASEPALKHTRGAVAMARSQMPDSASSQFYIALADLAFLDGNYAVFGYVTEGMDIVDNIQQGDRIQSAKVIEGIENLKK